MEILNQRTVYSLKSLCKQENYKGFSKCKNKEQLIQFIISKGYLEKDEHVDEVVDMEIDESNESNLTNQSKTK